MARRRVSYYTVEFDREDDGRWIADVPALPGCLVYGRTRRTALDRARRLAAQVVADLVANHESPPADYGSAKVTLVV